MFTIIILLLYTPSAVLAPHNTLNNLLMIIVVTYVKNYLRHTNVAMFWQYDSK